MRSIAIVFILAIGLAGCGVVDTLVDGFKHAKAVEAELETSVGMKPRVGFSWKNGVLTVVTVKFPRLYERGPLRELANTVSRSVASQFKQAPREIELSFAVRDTGTVALLGAARPQGAQ